MKSPLFCQIYSEKKLNWYQFTSEIFFGAYDSLEKFIFFIYFLSNMYLKVKKNLY